MRKKLVKYVWQCYSEVDEIFHPPLIKGDLDKEFLELQFNSPKQANTFKEILSEVDCIDGKEEWILCKLTIEEA